MDWERRLQNEENCVIEHAEDIDSLELPALLERGLHMTSTLKVLTKVPGIRQYIVVHKGFFSLSSTILAQLKFPDKAVKTLR